jgi:hypothetical protein
MSTAIKEHVFGGFTALKQGDHFIDGLRPERTLSQFIAFAANRDGRVVSFGDVGQFQVSDGDVCDLIGTSACVIEEEQNGMVTMQLRRGSLGRCQQGVHFRFFEISQGGLRSFFEWNRMDGGVPLKMLRAVLSDEVSEGPDGSQALVPGRDSAVAGLFQVSQESFSAFNRKVFHQESIERPLGVAG